MKSLKMKRHVSNKSRRKAAIITGIALFAMAVIAGFSNFGVIQNTIIPGNAVDTAANIIASATLFRLATLGLMMVAALDLVVALGIYIVFINLDRNFNFYAFFLRVIYAMIFAVIVSGLFRALNSASSDPVKSLLLLENFNIQWQLALIPFGVHLGIVGSLVWRHGIFSRITSVLLFIAGLGYIIDGTGLLIKSSYNLNLAGYLFAGEIVFIFWMFITGGRSKENPI